MSVTVKVGHIKKLPRWAQNHIGRLEQKIVELRRRLGNEPTTRISSGRAHGIVEPVYLREDLSIYFLVGDPGNDRDYLSVTLREHAIRVQGNDAFDVQPEASNTVMIALRDRKKS